MAYVNVIDNNNGDVVELIVEFNTDDGPAVMISSDTGIDLFFDHLSELRKMVEALEQAEREWKEHGHN